MIVREPLRFLDRGSLISEYLCYCGEPNTSRRRKIFNNLLDSFESLDVQPNTSQIVFCTPLLGDHQFDSSFLEKDELISALSENCLPQAYAYELCPMKDILGFSVSRACIYAFGEYKVACAILDEMTFFGCDLEVQRKAVTQESNQLQEAVSQIKEGLAGDISFDQVLKDIGFEVKSGYYCNVFKLIQEYRKKVNPKVNVFSVQTAGFTDAVIPEYTYRTNIMQGWTGKESVFADAMIKQWDLIESRNR